MLLFPEVTFMYSAPSPGVIALVLLVQLRFFFGAVRQVMLVVGKTNTLGLFQLVP